MFPLPTDIRSKKILQNVLSGSDWDDLTQVCVRWLQIRILGPISKTIGEPGLAYEHP